MGKLKPFIKALVLLIAVSIVGAHPVSAKESEKKIALTFDDGPHKKYTEEILDILDEYSVKATFFVVGVCAEKYPEIVAREIASGHEIGNHTYSHAHLRNIDSSVLVGEIEKAENLIFDRVNYRTTLFRPPEGVCNETVKAVARDMDYSIVLWTVDTRDWVPSSREKIISSVLDKVDGGEIILMHDYVAKKSNTPDALRVIIPALLERGFTFVTVSELLK